MMYHKFAKQSYFSLRASAEILGSLVISPQTINSSYEDDLMNAELDELVHKDYRATQMRIKIGTIMIMSLVVLYTLVWDFLSIYMTMSLDYAERVQTYGRVSNIFGYQFLFAFLFMFSSGLVLIYMTFKYHEQCREGRNYLREESKNVSIIVVVFSISYLIRSIFDVYALST